MSCEISMITQQELNALDKFQAGLYITVVNQELDKNGDIVYYLTFATSINTDDNEKQKLEVLYSQNGLRREFKRLDTVKDYLKRHCKNTLAIEIKLVNIENTFPHLSKINCLW